MSTYNHIRTTRRLVWAGIALMSALAVGITVVRIIGTEARTFGDVLGSVALGAAFSVPAVIAWTSLDRRPELLGAAGFSALVVSAIGLITLPAGVLIALLWRRAAERRPEGQYSTWRRLAFPVVCVIAVLLLFVHIDPVCTETRADGRTVEVDATERGFRTGWSLSLGGTVSSSSATLDGDVVASSCESDTIVEGEALASLAVTAGAVALARRWPVRPDSARRLVDSTKMEA